MRVVDVQPRAVGEHGVGEAEVVLGLTGPVVAAAGADVEAPRVAQRALLLEVPAGTAVRAGSAARRRNR